MLLHQLYHQDLHQQLSLLQAAHKEDHSKLYKQLSKLHYLKNATEEEYLTENKTIMELLKKTKEYIVNVGNYS